LEKFKPMKYILCIFAFFALIPAIFAGSPYFRFSSLPELPPNSGYSVQPGLAGVYTGIDDNVLIVAGGANFPGDVPWKRGSKTYYDEIFILQKNGEGDYSWKRMDDKIPFAAGYGGAVSTPFGLF
jgi:N-acetylneuraminic acid mutarotase